MPIAIQEDMLPGRTLLERLQNARALGIQGVEYWADDLTERIWEIAEAIDKTGVVAAGVNLSQRCGYLSPDMAEREAAINRMRQAMANAQDLQAPQVIFVPHTRAASAMPDLTPHRSAVELESEMMTWLLRTVSDLAYALDVTLYIQPANRYETHFLCTLDQAARFCQIIKDHPHVRLAPDTFHMALEEPNIYEALTTHQARIGYVHLADSNRRLPGQGLLDWSRLALGLRALGEPAWLTLTCGTPGQNQAEASGIYRQLPAALEHLAQQGLHTPPNA